MIAVLNFVSQVLWSISKWLPHSSIAFVSLKSSAFQDLISLCFSIVLLLSLHFLCYPIFVQELSFLHLLMQQFLWIFHFHPIWVTLIISQVLMYVISTLIGHHYGVFPKTDTFTPWEQLLCSSQLSRFVFHLSKIHFMIAVVNFFHPTFLFLLYAFIIHSQARPPFVFYPLLKFLLSSVRATNFTPNVLDSGLNYGIVTFPISKS